MATGEVPGGVFRLAGQAVVLDPATTARLDAVRVDEHRDGAGA